MTSAFLLALLFGSLAVTALVAAPLRRALPRTWLAVLAAVPVLAMGVYLLMGAPQALDPAVRTPAPMAAGDAQVDPAEFAAAIAGLRAELERNPQQPEGWVLLGRSLAVQGDAAGARDAYAKALELVPDEPALMVELAQASARADAGHRFDDAAVALLRQALALQPSNQRARWFLGVALRQRGQDADAVETWEPLLPLVDTATAGSLREQIAEARVAAGMPPAEPAADAAARPDAPAQGPSRPTRQAADDGRAAAANGLRVRVRLAPGLAARVDDGGTVFVMARAPDGPPMPVAAERHPVSALPLDVVLDDSDSPMPTQVLSQLDTVVVSARLSAGGTAERGAGDIESAAVRVSLPSRDVVELVLGAD